MLGEMEHYMFRTILRPLVMRYDEHQLPVEDKRFLQVLEIVNRHIENLQLASAETVYLKRCARLAISKLTRDNVYNHAITQAMKEIAEKKIFD